MTEIQVIREDKKATAILEAIRLIDEGAELAPVVHGWWAPDWWRPKCSLCGFQGSVFDIPVNPFNYCPNCGAKMDLEAADGQN